MTHIDDNNSDSDSDDGAFYVFMEKVKAVEEAANSGTGSTAEKVGEGEEERGRVKAGKRKRAGRERLPAPLKRDKRGKIIRMCGVDGCLFKTRTSSHMSYHKAIKHNIGENIYLEDT